MTNNNLFETVDSKQVLRYRPDTYPKPNEKNQAFFIQRNHNQNAVVYIYNINNDGLLNLNNPLSIYWMRYSDSKSSLIPTIEKLNHIQKSLAYGYEHSVISSNLIKFNFVCHNMVFYIVKDNNQYKVITSFEGENYQINHIYVYAEELGAFPIVLSADFQCTSMVTKLQSIKTVSFG